MDLNAFEQKDNFDYPLVLPNGDASDVVFTLAGPTNPQREKFETAQQRRNLRDFNKYKGTRLPEDPQKLIDVQVDRLVASTLGWVNLAIDGTAITFTPAAARELYTNPRFLWIRDRITAQLGIEENFTGNASTG